MVLSLNCLKELLGLYNTEEAIILQLYSIVAAVEEVVILMILHHTLIVLSWISWSMSRLLNHYCKKRVL